MKALNQKRPVESNCYSGGRRPVCRLPGPTVFGKFSMHAPVVVVHPELLRKREVASLLGIGLRSLNRNVQQGRFPGPIRLGTRTLRYSRRAVLAWIAEQSAGGAITK